MKRILPWFFISWTTSVTVHAQFANDNVLVNNLNTVYEYTKDGVLVSELAIPTNAASETSRDLVVLDDGRLAVFNGTFAPELAIFDGVNWQNKNFDSWSIVNNGSFGGIAAIGSDVYVTDQFINNGGESQGVVRFALATDDTQHFANASGYIDITAGQDGLLYGLKDYYGKLDIIHPHTMSVTRSVDLGHTSSSRGVTANKLGEIFMVSWDGYVAHYSAEGTFINNLTLGGSLSDIDINSEGQLLVSGRFDQAYIIDETLTNVIQLPVTGANMFVAFTLETKPESPILNARKTRKGKLITTVLDWVTEANSVDIYFNGQIIGTTSDNAATYSYSKKQRQVFQVCNHATTDCSSTFTANN